MATWSYANWRAQSTAAGKLAMLASHIAEVAAVVDANSSGAATSVDYGPLAAYLERLEREWERWDDLARRESAGRFGRGTLRH